MGQAFADEMFRVFRNAHPDTKILSYNTNDRIKMMISYVQAEKTNVMVPSSPSDDS